MKSLLSPIVNYKYLTISCKGWVNWPSFHQHVVSAAPWWLRSYQLMGAHQSYLPTYGLVRGVVISN